jgi:hypothetical protein
MAHGGGCILLEPRTFQGGYKMQPPVHPGGHRKCAPIAGQVLSVNILSPASRHSLGDGGERVVKYPACKCYF